jgi:uncharacterized protein YjbJ (UPF0337 family)
LRRKVPARRKKKVVPRRQPAVNPLGVRALSLRTRQARDEIEEMTVMGSTMDKAKGHANDAIGNAKQAVGKATGNDRLRAEGAAQELKGEGQKLKGEAKDAVKKAANL